jgi:hypothetical protein
LDLDWYYLDLSEAYRDFLSASLKSRNSPLASQGEQMALLEMFEAKIKLVSDPEIEKDQFLKNAFLMYAKQIAFCHSKRRDLFTGGILSSFEDFDHDLKFFIQIYVFYIQKEFGASETWVNYSFAQIDLLQKVLNLTHLDVAAFQKAFKYILYQFKKPIKDCKFN